MDLHQYNTIQPAGLVSALAILTRGRKDDQNCQLLKKTVSAEV